MLFGLEISEKMERPCIVVDVDGVILNFSRSFCTWFNKKFEGKFCLVENPKTWSYDDRVPPEEMGKEIELFMSTNPFLPLMENEIPLVFDEILKTHDIHLVTACSAQWSESRMCNLTKHGVRFTSIQFTKDKMEAIRLLKPVLVFEDKPSTIRDVVVKLGITVCFPFFWNYLDDIEKCVTQQHQRDLMVPYLSWTEERIKNLLK